MKNTMLNLFAQMEEKLNAMEADPELFVKEINSRPDTLYRADLFAALKDMGIENNVAARISQSVAIETSSYDSTISESFIHKMVVPLFKLSLKNKDKLTVIQHLSDEELLLIFAKDVTLTYKT